DRLGRPARALHGNVGQRERERVLEGFRRGRIPTVVATNLAARGLHVEDIGHVVNFDLPENAETYVHRVGRTGRAGRRGIAYTFVNEMQRKDFDDIRRAAKVAFRRETLTLPASPVRTPDGATRSGRRVPRSGAGRPRWAASGSAPDALPKPRDARSDQHGHESSRKRLGRPDPQRALAADVVLVELGDALPAGVRRAHTVH